MIERAVTRKISVGGVEIGGGADISVQSMTGTDTRDAKKTLEQIGRLAEAGCDIVRVAVPDFEAAEAVREIKKGSPMPVVADIHFDFRLAVAAAEAGADKIRINPGNIGAKENVAAVAAACRKRKLPIRIGINAGSLDRDLLEKYGGPEPEAMVASAERQIKMLEEYDFTDICISLKASSVPKTIAAYRLISGRCEYPLHLGVTEAGSEYMGTLKSAAGIGGLLAMGIGDTVRVSLTTDPVKEVYAAKAILKAVGLNKNGVTVISCPTCGRCKINLIELASQIEKRVEDIDKKMTVAVMGCAVNGPGEAKEADIGIAGGDKEGLLFKKGVIVGKLPEDRLVSALMEEIENY